MGLALFPESGYCATVSSFLIPEDLTAQEVCEGLLHEHNIMVAGSFDEVAGKLIRIGHMGENARMEQVQELLDALEEILRSWIR